MFKRDRPEGPLRSKATGPKDHYAQKELLDYKYRPEGPMCSKATGPKDHYVQVGPARSPRFFIWSGAFSRF
jgi:hypothetical protein